MGRCVLRPELVPYRQHVIVVLPNPEAVHPKFMGARRVEDLPFPRHPFPGPWIAKPSFVVNGVSVFRIFDCCGRHFVTVGVISDLDQQALTERLADAEAAYWCGGGIRS